MMIRTIALSVLLLAPLSAFAQNVGQCGWGSKLFAGQKGLVPQVLAVTTNGTSGNQTFAMTSGTSGCTQDGVVRSNWKTAAYIDANMNRFARDASRGEGEAISSLASLLEMSQEESIILASALQQNFGEIFPNAEVSSQEVVAAVRAVLASHPQLSGFSARV